MLPSERRALAEVVKYRLVRQCDYENISSCITGELEANLLLVAAALPRAALHRGSVAAAAAEEEEWNRKPGGGQRHCLSHCTFFLEGPFFFKQSGPAFNLGFFEMMLHNGAVALPALPRLLPAPPLPHHLLPAEIW